ncbi:hypothetical protein LA080_012681 [Diaporthe eres]|nr:hypothetical protein LA080_012681 [Diaporthe eres]
MVGKRDCNCIHATYVSIKFCNRQGFIVPLFTRYVVRHGHGFKLNEWACFDWVHVEDPAGVYLLLVRAILEREDHGVGYIPTGKNGIISTAVGRVLQTEMMRLCLDTAFDAGVLPREDTPKGKEIRQVELKELAEEIMGGLVDMAERSWAGRQVMKGTVARKLLGWNPTRLDEAWKQDYREGYKRQQSGNLYWEVGAIKLISALWHEKVGSPVPFAAVFGTGS